MCCKMSRRTGAVRWPPSLQSPVTTPAKPGLPLSCVPAVVMQKASQGQAIRFLETQVRPMGRQARGVRAMHLGEGDYLIGMEVVEKDGLILSIAENGYGKRTPLENYRLTARGGKGVINMKTT